jgi:hypothetical protein
MTLSGGTVTDKISTLRGRRGLAAAFALCAMASLALMASHPDGNTRNLAEFIQDAARNRFRDGLVHGGFIVTLGALSVCFVYLSRLLGSAKIPVVIGQAAFFAGCAVLSASMILDGFATPALAARFVGGDNADNLATAKPLLMLLGTLIGLLMPTGLLLQSVAIFSWSSVIAAGRGLQRAVGLFGLTSALALITATFAAPAAMAPHFLIGGLLLLTLWYLALAGLLYSREAWT